jgi:hypothetical protein
VFLVDLAGSERVKRSEVLQSPPLPFCLPVCAAQAVSINTSLTCLGRCVAALAAGGKGANRPPFRESKLTRLLSSAFGGRSTTILVSLLNCFLYEYSNVPYSAMRGRKLTRIAFPPLSMRTTF